MARKVFISFLGTNNYVLCRYAMNNVVSEPVRFVQEALIANTCKDWMETDKIFIFCTSKESTGENGSKELNWLDNGQTKITDEADKIGLQHRLLDLKSKTGLKPQIEQIDIEAGFSEEEIWNIFNTVYSKLQPEDQIYFDVTHAFRSIPLFSVVLFNYSKMMIGTQLMSIMYGAFEKLGPAFKVREMSMDNRIAPVIDLTNIARLQEYNQIASNLKYFGKAKRLKDAIASELNATPNQAVRDLCNSISELDEYIATIDLQEIKKGHFIKRFRDNYRKVMNLKLAQPIRDLLKELNDETADFVAQDSYKNIEAAINWTIKHDMLMQAYPLAEEYIILRFYDVYKSLKPSLLYKKQFKEFISSILGMPDEDYITKNWKSTLATYPDVADEIADDSQVQEIRPLYAPVRAARNSLAHGNGNIKYVELRKGIPAIIECIKHLNVAYESYPSTKTILDRLEKK